MLYTERYTYYYASLKIACQMELRKAGQTVGKIWLSIGLCSLVLGYIYPSTVRAAKGIYDLLLFVKICYKIANR